MSTDAAPVRRIPTGAIIAMFATIFGLLALGYFVFLRADYVAVFSQIRPAEASAIVGQLEAKNIAYKLTDGGTTILVPAGQADQARLAIAGSDVGLKGGVGFELFNKSDMGLTDFAQRINYQRALQGELERSIMMLDGVESARVHLAMPERTIFRSERSSAKAAVELVAKGGRPFDDARVAGIQRLVAFAVPDLVPADVVILDGDGRVLSASSSDGTALPPDLEERQGVQGYYRARARAALEQVLPDLQAQVKVIALGGNTDGTAADAGPNPVDGNSAAASSPSAPAAAPAARNFRLRVIVATASPLATSDEARARDAVVSALALDEAKGDEVAFQVGLGPAPVAPAIAAAPSALPSPGESRFAAPPSAGTTSWSLWFAIGAVTLVAGLFGLSFLVGPRARLSADERAAMVERVRAALRSPDGDHAAV